MTDKILNLLGLAKRAGKIITGEELVVKSIQHQTAKFIFLANDASNNLNKKIIDKSNTYQIKISTKYNQEELSAAIGSDRKVLAVMDNGFAKKMENLLMQ
ncbi:YlxQ-related RNA-binding protein [Lactovum miscens]|uniref:Ribosomal protein L7Ae-like RNA K-turn-binding protein n=1 Tax=Lactovum miscens TaxID=190387 RepID=A0A841CB99_9LACT|nr:ribosomal protein L7Ae-like RNA K-turn-binding protein [Lactovum miscens]